MVFLIDWKSYADFPLSEQLANRIPLAFLFFFKFSVLRHFRHTLILEWAKLLFSPTPRRNAYEMKQNYLRLFFYKLNNHEGISQ